MFISNIFFKTFNFYIKFFLLISLFFLNFYNYCDCNCNCYKNNNKIDNNNKDKDDENLNNNNDNNDKDNNDEKNKKDENKDLEKDNKDNKDNKDDNNDDFDINKIDLSSSIKIGNGNCNDIYKIKYKNKTVVFSKNKTNDKLYKRYNIDYIAKNTFYKFFFSKNQPKIYNEYFCEFINGFNLCDKYQGNIIYSINDFNNDENNTVKLIIDEKIKNKLIIQDIIFRTGDQGPRNQIYITEDIDNGEKKIIKDVVFIDLDFDLYRYIQNEFETSDDNYIFNNGKTFDKYKIVPLDKNIQHELIKILDVNIDDFVKLLDKNIENAVEKNQKFIKYITSDGKYNFNVINTFDFPIVKIYENTRRIQGTEIKIVEKINYINDFNEYDKELIIGKKIIEFSKLKYENNKVYVKYKDNDNFEELNETFSIFAKINNFELKNGSFYGIENGNKHILPNICINNDIINNKNIEIIDYKTAKKETILIYLTYILEKIKLCIDSGDFNLVKDDLKKLKSEYEEYIKNLKK